jgi:hypothetical protein
MAKTAQAVIETKVKDSASAGFRKVDKAMQNTAKQGKVLNQQFRFMRGGLGQVGHQVQDVAVQLQMGQNAMLVFGQQGSQIASLFGPGGALLGAVLAVGAALSMALLPRLFGATQAAKALKAEMKNLADNFDTLTEAQKKLVRTQVGKQIADNNALMLKQRRELNDLTSITLSFNEIFFGKDSDEKADRIEELRASLDVLKQQNIDLNKSIDDTTNSFEKQDAALNKQIKTFGLQGHALRVAGYEADLLAKKITQTEADKLIARSQTLAQLEIDAEREKEIINEVSEEQKKAAKVASDAIKAKEKSARQFADGFASSFTNAITTAEDFKDAMKMVAKSVVDSLIKMIIQKQIADAIFNMIPASLGGGKVSTGGFNTVRSGTGATQIPTGGIPHRATGGTVSKDQPYIVGERGHELFVPSQSGNIIPNNKLGGAEVTVNQTINITTGVQQTVRAEIANLMPQITDATKSAVANARMRGGNFSKSLVGV